MGEVFEAVHIEIGAHVALKFLSQSASGDPTSLVRFRREARAAATIGHPAIIGVQDLGTTPEGALFLVMELLKGQSLGERLGFVGYLDIPLTAYIGSQVLSGLAAAHRASIVHRDLKVENIFLVDTGAPLPGVKILDFGISQMAEGSTIQNNVRLTQTGMVMGTPAYMSPEQARGQTVDHRTDIYSLGVILYECLAGKLPFEGRNYNAVVAALLTENPPPLNTIRPELGAPFEKIVHKALRKDPAQRYQSASEMLQELLLFVEERAVGNIPIPDDLMQDGESFELIGEEDDRDMVGGAPTRRGAHSTGLWWENDSKNQHLLFGASRRLVLGVFTLLVIAVGTVAVVLWWSGHDEVTPEPTATPTQQAARVAEPEIGPVAPPAPPAAPEAAVIKLQNLPRGAQVYLNDALVDKLPLHLWRGGPMMILRVEAEGYEPFTTTLEPDEDMTLDVAMTPAKTITPAPSGKLRGRPGKRRTSEKQPQTGQKRHQPGYLVPPPTTPYLEDR